MDLERKLRKHIRELGNCEGKIEYKDGKPSEVWAKDDELQGRIFTSKLGPPSKYELQLKHFHEDIYRERAQEKYNIQGGKCASCEKDLRGSGECDHIRSRGRNGRSDLLQNLQIVCSVFSGGCNFHGKKHGGTK